MANEIAHELAKQQRQISIAEFFEKNRLLLGYANKAQALLTSVKEAVDNSLDACEEAGILPEISVEIKELKKDILSVVKKTRECWEKETSKKERLEYLG